VGRRIILRALPVRRIIVTCRLRVSSLRHRAVSQAEPLRGCSGPAAGSERASLVGVPRGCRLRNADNTRVSVVPKRQ
jgi:hypothetical protein